MPQHNSFHRRQLREHCLPVPLSPVIADSNRTNTCPLVVLILDQNWTKDSSILLIIYLQALNQQYFGHSHLDFLPVRVREEWSLGCVHSCPSACIVQCQLRQSSDPHHITHGAKGQWIKQWQLATRLTEWVASLLKWLLSFCQHGHTVSETPCTWYWPSTHRCYQREGFFEEERRLSAWQPQDTPKGLWRSQSESLVCQAVIHSPTCSTFPGNFTWDAWPPSFSPLEQFINHICKQGDQRAWPSCSEKLEMGGTIFSHGVMEDATPKQHELGNHQIY